MTKIKCKPEVIWNVCPEIEKAQEAIMAVYKEFGVEAVVTSAKDGKHSRNSAHHQLAGDMRPSNAIDLRTIHVVQSEWKRLQKTLETKLNSPRVLMGLKGRWYVVLESNHIHLEYAEGVPNIKGYKPGLYLYGGG